MKLLISAYACIPNRGSEPGVGWNWVLQHALLGHEVWCFTTPEGESLILKEMKKFSTLNLHFIFVPSPAWANWLYRFQPFVYFHYLLWQYNAAKLAIDVDKKVDFDLILHITLSSFQLGSGFWRLKKPLVFGPVGGGNFAPKAFQKYFGFSWYMEMLRKVTSTLLLRLNPDVKKTCKQAKLILVANKDTYQMASKISKADIRIFLDSGLSDDFFIGEKCVRNVQPVLRILWVGRIFARKGLPLVLEALSKVSGDVPFQLSIIGDGKLGHRVPQWIKRYGLEKKVTWYGQQSWSQVRKAYQEHDVFLFCSLRDSFGSQFMEAMAYGLPIITLDHQGAGDHISKACGIKIAVTQPTETTLKIARAVEFMYHNPDLRILYSKHCREFAKAHRWETKVKSISVLYDDLVRDKSFRKEYV